VSQTLLDEPSQQMKSRRVGRTITVIVMLVALVLSAVTRDWARNARELATRGNSPINTASQTRISGMNSFTLALLLGGLRGPLVMMLWTSSETQKQDKNLEDFDTKVELIRLLQPEFASVHIFQMWNKAYNISVQMSSLFNKYTTILDAIDYGTNMLRVSPDDINILVATADIYFNKLGNASEKQYYRAQVRRETLPHKTNQRLQREDPGWRRLELDPILDANGNLDPKLIKPTRERPASLAADDLFNDGSEYQYIAQFQPFKYGASPIAIAYNYYMKAQTLQRTTHAKHAQLGEQVIDSRPSISLKFWAEEEQELGRRNEIKAFGMPAVTSTEKLDLELPAAKVPPTQTPNDQAAFQEAIYNYDRAAQVAVAARAEYARHLKINSGNLFTYQSHLDGLHATEHFALADAAYLRAMTATGADRLKWAEVAQKEYVLALNWFQRILMKYYTDEGIVAAVLPGVTKEQIDNLPFDVLDKATFQIQMAVNRGAPDAHMDDRTEYVTYFTRCGQRMELLKTIK